MNWSRTAEIARWEYTQKVKQKGFIISLILTPLMIMAFGVLPGLLASQSPEESVEIGLVDQSGLYGPEFVSRIGSEYVLEDGSPAYRIRIIGQADATQAADSLSLSEEIEGTIVITGDSVDPRLTYRSPNPSNIRILSAVESTFEDLFTERRLEQEGIDSAIFSSLTREFDVQPYKVTQSGASEAGFLETFFSAYVGLILFLILVVMSGQTLVRGLVEEKSGRIMEILVSNGTPSELMWGKLIGLSGLGFTQVGAWLLLGLLALAALPAVTGFQFEVDPALLEPLPWVLLYLILGYLLYSAIFIGVGSLVTTEQEAQIVTQYLTMVLVIPMAFAFAVMQDPGATYIQALSFFPLLTPALMMLRVVVKMPDQWELLLSVLVLLVSIAGVTFAASRIFRTSILLQGKRPSFREIARVILKAD